MEKSYGLLVFREINGSREYLVVHPSGNYNKNSPYYIPKGGANLNETPEAAALRETFEETGISAKIITPLSEVVHKNKRKKIVAFLGYYLEGEIDENGNCPKHDWENDVVKFVKIDEAKKLIREEYRVLFDLAENYIEEMA